MAGRDYSTGTPTVLTTTEVPTTTVEIPTNAGTSGTAVDDMDEYIFQLEGFRSELEQ